MLHPWDGRTPGWEITLVAIRISLSNALLAGLAFLIRSFRACSSEERPLIPSGPALHGIQKRTGGR